MKLFKNDKIIANSACNMDGREKKMANLVWQVWQEFCLKKFSAKLHLPLNRSLCKKPEHSNINQRSWKNMQVTAVSCLSHTNVLLSCCAGSLILVRTHAYFLFLFMSKVLPRHGPVRYLVIISSFWSGQGQVQHQTEGILILGHLR